METGRVPQVRQSVPGTNKTGEAHQIFLPINQLKAIETHLFRPRYALAEPWGTRPDLISPA